MSLKVWVLSSMVSLALATTASATVKVGNATYEDTMSLGAGTVQLSGAGMRTKVFFDVYAAGLYLSGKATSFADVLKLAAPMRVRLVMARDVGAKTFVDALVEGLADNTSPKVRELIQNEIDALINCMNQIGDVKKGDVIDFDYSAEEQTRVSVNGRTIAKNVGGRQLYNSVLGIWLGPKAIDASLKAAMLGQ